VDGGMMGKTQAMEDERKRLFDVLRAVAVQFEVTDDPWWHKLMHDIIARSAGIASEQECRDVCVRAISLGALCRLDAELRSMAQSVGVRQLSRADVKIKRPRAC
jgi:hypothetical protein